MPTVGKKKFAYTKKEKKPQKSMLKKAEKK